MSGSARRVPSAQRADVLGGDVHAVLGPQQVLQQDLQAERQVLQLRPRDPAGGSGSWSRPRRERLCCRSCSRSWVVASWASCGAPSHPATYASSRSHGGVASRASATRPAGPGRAAPFRIILTSSYRYPSLMTEYLDVKLHGHGRPARPPGAVASPHASPRLRLAAGSRRADPFGLAALPYCSFSTRRHAASRRAGVRIGDQVLDLTTAPGRLLPGREVLFRDGILDAFLADGDGAWADVRAEITAWLAGPLPRGGRGPADPGGRGRAAPAVHGGRLRGLLRLARARDQRGPDLPAGRHGSAAAELAAPAGRLPRPGGQRGASGTAIRRPCGQLRGTRDGGPVYGPTERLDFEAELGFVVGVETVLGEPVAVSRFAEHVFGVCLVNDWSARDIQAWSRPRSGPSWASRSAPRSRPGSCRWPRWSTPGCGRRRGTPRWPIT